MYQVKPSELNAKKSTLLRKVKRPPFLGAILIPWRLERNTLEASGQLTGGEPRTRGESPTGVRIEENQAQEGQRDAE